ncbi:hypothetical protein DSM112329_04745 [Paraconexibacter sp. AEG42_29]|uniref:Uncharacterized protein n=1 Tax=Paraconexibacter sp. AEG42_29 TaxID=2997339 RepID=A0AAU7B1M4_9ACTN
MRVNPLSKPEYAYPYLLDAAALQMAASVADHHKLPWKRAARHKAVLVESDLTYKTWPRTLWRRPQRTVSGLKGVRWPGQLDERTRVSLIVDASFVELYGSAGISVKADERRDALLQLAVFHKVDPSWVDRALEVSEDARRSHRSLGDYLSPKGSVLSPAQGAVATVTPGMKLPHLVGARAGFNGVAASRYGLVWLGYGSSVAGDQCTTNGHWLLRSPHNVGDMTADSAVTGATAGLARGTVLAGIGVGRAVSELIRMQTLAAVVDHEALGNSLAGTAATDQLAEVRAEVQHEVATLRDVRPPKERESREAELVARHLDNAIDWLHALR